MRIGPRSQPYYVQSRKAWFVNVYDSKGKRQKVRLGETKTEALAQVSKMQAAGEPLPHDGGFLFIHLADEWLSFQEKRRDRGEVSRGWLARVLATIQDFLTVAKDLTCDELKPVIVRRWIDAKNWRPDTERTVIGVLRQVLTWGVDQGMIPANRLAGMKTPTPQPRDYVVSPLMHLRLMANASKRARFIIEALRLTGCRPSEIRSVKIENIASDLGYFVLKDHKNAKHGKVRTVYLSSGAKRLFRTVIGERKEGFVFLDRDGKQLSRNCLRCMFRRLRTKLKTNEPVNSYSFRHTFATNALVRGLPIATVAELLGNSSKMIEKHYGHLAKQPDHLREMMDRAIN
jgi:integrase